MAVGQDRIINTYEDQVRAGKLTLLVKSVERFWAGDGSGGQEEQPGTFLDTTINVVGCSKRGSTLEKLAAERKVRIYENKKEITNEPKGYSRLFYDDFLDNVKKDARYYLNNIGRAVKETM